MAFGSTVSASRLKCPAKGVRGFVFNSADRPRIDRRPLSLYNALRGTRNLVKGNTMHQDRQIMTNKAFTELSFGAHNALWRCGRSVRGVDIIRNEVSNLGI
jgi:hypothetical protein